MFWFLCNRSLTLPRKWGAAELEFYIQRRRAVIQGRYNLFYFLSYTRELSPELLLSLSEHNFLQLSLHTRSLSLSLPGLLILNDNTRHSLATTQSEK